MSLLRSYACAPHHRIRQLTEWMQQHAGLAVAPAQCSQVRRRQHTSVSQQRHATALRTDNDSTTHCPASTPGRAAELTLSSIDSDADTATPAITANEFAQSMSDLRLSPDDSIAVAVSGGSDSTALTLLLHEWYKQTGGSGRLLAICINHSLRPEAAAEIKYCNQWLHQHGIEYVNAQINGLANNHNQLQEHARHKRYALLHSICQQHNIKYVATGHHADDQLETQLLRLFRSSSLIGLAGIPPIQPLDAYCTTGQQMTTAIRPVLQYNKPQLMSTCRRFCQQWCIDLSNESDKYDRNRVRQAIRQIVGVTSEQLHNMSRTLVHVGTDVKSILATMTQAYTRRQTQDGVPTVTLHLDDCADIHTSIVSAMALQIVSTLAPASGIQSNAVTALINAARDRSLKTNRRYLLGNCLVKTDVINEKWKLVFRARNAVMTAHDPDRPTLNADDTAALILRCTRVHPIDDNGHARITVKLSELLKTSNDTIREVLRQLLMKCVPTNKFKIASLDRFITALQSRQIVIDRRQLLGNCTIKARGGNSENKKHKYYLLDIEPRKELVTTQDDGDVSDQ